MKGEIARALAPVARRVRLRRLAEGFSRGALAGAACAVLNGANEAAVARFLEGKIGFLDIADRVRRAMEQVKVIADPSMTQVLEADAAAREAVLSV